MFFLHAVWFPALLAGCRGVAAFRSDSFFSELRPRQDVSLDEPVPPQCNTTCTNFDVISDDCNSSHCGCTFNFLSAQGLCFLCLNSDPHNAAKIQFLLDNESAQCHREGIAISYSLPLDPVAAAIVQQTYHEDSVLRRNQTVFLALQIIGGHVGLFVVLIFAVFSPRIRRDPTFLNFCMTWIFSSIIFSLMLYRGTSENTTLNTLGEVVPNQCLVQAALTEGAQVMTASSTLSLVVRLWLSLRAAIYGEPKGSRQHWWITSALLISPYLFFLIFALASVFIGLQLIIVADSTIQRAMPVNFYCTVAGPAPFIQGVYGVTLVLLLITMGFDVYIISILYRHWAAFRNIQTKSAVPLSLLLRVIIFSLYRIVVAVAYVSVLKGPPQTGSSGEGETLSVTFGFPVWVDMLQAAIPLLGALILGIRTDMLSAITFLHKRGTDDVSLRSINERDITDDNHKWDKKVPLPEDPIKFEV